MQRHAARMMVIRIRRQLLDVLFIFFTSLGFLASYSMGSIGFVDVIR